MYNPLPPGLFIDESSIHGQGLYTNVKLKRDYQLGISHVQVGGELYRTPLGGFINHSDNPNCIKVMSLKTTILPDEKKGPKYVVWNLSTTRDIEEGEELTVKYTFYKI